MAFRGLSSSSESEEEEEVVCIARKKTKIEEEAYFGLEAEAQEGPLSSTQGRSRMCPVTAASSRQEGRSSGRVRSGSSSSSWSGEGSLERRQDEEETGLASAGPGPTDSKRSGAPVKTENAPSEKKKAVPVCLAWPPPSTEDADEGDESPASVPEATDAEAAVRMLRPAKLRPRVVFRHHVYFEVSNRSAADRDLERLAAAGRVRLLQLPTASDDQGVVLKEDWDEELLIAKRTSPACSNAVFDGFAELAVRRGSDLYVTRAELDAALPEDTDDRANGLDCLLASGLLRPRRPAGGDDDDFGSDSFWFACPRFGELARRVRYGRAAIYKALRASRFKQLQIDKNTDNAHLSSTTSSVAQRKNNNNKAGRNNNVLRLLDDVSSPNYFGGVDFHVRDLVAKGAATLETRPNGRFLRLVR